MHDHATRAIDDAQRAVGRYREADRLAWRRDAPQTQDQSWRWRDNLRLARLVERAQQCRDQGHPQQDHTKECVKRQEQSA